jgi:hypothetical protein
MYSDVPVFVYVIHTTLNLITEYTITTNTHIYCFFININSMATCFDQMLVIFRDVQETKITLQMQIPIMVRLGFQSRQVSIITWDFKIVTPYNEMMKF